MTRRRRLRLPPPPLGGGSDGTGLRWSPAPPPMRRLRPAGSKPGHTGIRPCTAVAVVRGEGEEAPPARPSASKDIGDAGTRRVQTSPQEPTRTHTKRRRESCCFRLVSRHFGLVAR